MSAWSKCLKQMYRYDFNEPEVVGTSTMLKYGEVLHKDKKLMGIFDRGISKKYWSLCCSIAISWSKFNVAK